MNTLRDKVEQAFRHDVATLSYRQVSVKLLCEQAGVPRKSFYRHFRGKSDVLAYVYERDVVGPQLELCTLLSFARAGEIVPSMERRMFEAVYADRDFYRSVVCAPDGGLEAFRATSIAVQRGFYEKLLAGLGFAGDELHAAYVADFFASAKTHLIAKWIEEGFALDAAGIADLYADVTHSYWESLATHKANLAL